MENTISGERAAAAEVRDDILAEIRGTEFVRGEGITPEEAGERSRDCIPMMGDVAEAARGKEGNAP